MRLEALTRSIAYSFNDSDLLLRALTHRSFGATHNERLEFLGDSVLNCAIALELYRKFPDLAEGELSRIRASLVSQPSLAAVAVEHQVGDHLRLGEGELKSGGARRPSMLADAVEAIIGAAFLDGGFDAATTVVRALFAQVLEKTDAQSSGKDAKTLLQEYMQSRKLPLPRYSVTAVRGQAHEQVFEVECEIAELDVRTTGEGVSRRGAEQDAAALAYKLALAR